MKIKLLFGGLLTPALAFTSNALVYPAAKILDGFFDIYWNKPFQIPAFETFAVSPDVPNKYAGVYSMPQAPVKFTITRGGAALDEHPKGQSAVPLKATAADKFRIEIAGIFLSSTPRKTR